MAWRSMRTHGSWGFETLKLECDALSTAADTDFGQAQIEGIVEGALCELDRLREGCEL